jgi:(2Fe-2S) ferredoxin
MSGFKHHIFICMNERTAEDPRGSCTAKGSETVHDAFKTEVKKRGLKSSVRANRAGCLDHCAMGPSVVIYPQGVWYRVNNPKDVAEIIEKHVCGGKIVERLLMGDHA